MKIKRFFAFFVIIALFSSFVFSQDNTPPKDLNLTQTEKEFVATLPTLSVLIPTIDWPFCDIKNKSNNQALANYFSYLSNLTGIKFELIYGTGLSNKKINLTGNARYSSEMIENFSDITVPYFYSYKLLVEKGSATHKDFSNPQRIGTTGIRTDEVNLLRKTFESNKTMPAIKKYENSYAAINALKNKDVDCILLNQNTLYALQKRPEYKNLMANPLYIYEDNFCIQLATMPQNIDGQTLLNILNKAILYDENAMQNFVNEAIAQSPKVSQWEYAQRYKWEFLILIIIFFIVFFGILLFEGQSKTFSSIFTSKTLQLETLSSSLNTGIVEIDLKSLKIEFANMAFLSIVQNTETNPDILMDEVFTDFIAKQEVERFLAEIGRLNIHNSEESLKKSFSLEIRLLRRDGSTLPVIMNATISKKKNAKDKLYIIMFDNSSQIFALEKYQSSKEKFESIMEKTNEIQYDIDLVTGQITADDNLIKKMGWTFPHKISKSDLPTIWHLSKQYEEEFKLILDSVITTGEARSAKVKMKKSSGIDIWCEILLNPIKNTKNETIKIFGTIEDVDFETREKELIMFKANTDPLTGLYQKEAFFDLCRKFIREAIKAPNTTGALIFMDMDNFKQINDILGHIEGDNAICDAARKLQLIFSQYDIISRFGGDEFCIFVKNIPIDTLTDKLNWLLEKMKQTYTIGDNSVMTTASIGVALFPKDGNSLEQLLDCADKALYESKNNGKNQFSFF